MDCSSDRQERHRGRERLSDEPCRLFLVLCPKHPRLQFDFGLRSTCVRLGGAFSARRSGALTEGALVGFGKRPLGLVTNFLGDVGQMQGR